MRNSQNGSFYAVPSEGEIPTEGTRRLSLEESDALECQCLASGGGGVASGGGAREAAEGFDIQNSSSLSEMELRHWGSSSNYGTAGSAELPPGSFAMDTRDAKNS